MAGFSCLLDLLSNEESARNAAVDTLIRICQNILKAPSNLKFRSLKISSNVIQSTLLPAAGGMDCLFQIGFKEAADCEKLELPMSAPLTVVQKMCDELIKVKHSTHPSKPAATQLSLPSCSTMPSTPPIKPQKPPDRYSPLLQTTQNSLLLRLIHQCNRVVQYEDLALQKRCLELVPLLDIQNRAQQNLKNLQKSYKNKELNEEHQDYQILLLSCLVTWFKEDFFSWVNGPVCGKCFDECTKSKGVKASPAPDIDRIEVWECEKCNMEAYFPRYNDLGKLLETRMGRCGEWANCFTLICRAMGWDSRLVHDETDHAWTEIYLDIPGRWVHCDPCEGVVDAPLLYEAGWKKKLTYVLATSHEEVQDVTWRYSSHHRQVLSRRKACDENELLQLIQRLNEVSSKYLSLPRQNYLLKRRVFELADFLIERKPTEADIRGRLSGSLQWRQQRGELGDLVPCIWKLDIPGSVSAHRWELSYSSATDTYRSGDDVTSGWTSGVSQAVNVHRKVEKDWKMAYLARTEGSEKGFVCWSFEAAEGLIFDKIELTFPVALYQSGKVTVTLCSGDACVRVPAGDKKWVTEAFKGRSGMMELKAELGGGEGAVAWQHAQLFRESLQNTATSFQLTIYLSRKSA